jgi:hypothetical protein
MNRLVNRCLKPVTLALLVAVTLAGCGGEDDAEPAASQASTGGTTPGSGTAAPPPSTGGGTGAPPPSGGTGGAPPGAGTGGAAQGQTYSVELSWTAPAEYEDGTPFVDLGGYRLRFGPSPGTYTRVIDVRPDTTTVTVSALKAATYYFALTAYNNAGAESALSNELTVRLN